MSSDVFKFKFSKYNPFLEKAGNVSMSYDGEIALNDDTFFELRDLIYSRCGIYFTDGKKYLLEGRIAKRLSSLGLKSFEEYNKFLKTTNNRLEFNQLFEVITINETYFFRAEFQLEAFEKVVVPEIIKNKINQNQIKPVFRIWSSASSTGEEPYSLAIIVLEKLMPLYPNVSFQIIASDINNAVLEKARQGIFKEYSIRNLPAVYLKKYFKQNAGNYIISEDIKKMVTFKNINLYDTQAMKAENSYDVIFCCNVLIYFDIPSKQQVISYLYNNLNPGGYLFIGYSESLHGISKAFKLIHLPKAMTYKKE
jgi:chemotaxis protein methyltransferase CheR